MIGADAASDIAVIQIKDKFLKEIPLSDSENLEVGDFVAAIGNPFGLNQTVTSGVISALNRSINLEGYEDFIQTDAPINPGNSGGALINMKGELVGINTAILAPTGVNVGIGFAIPSNMAHNVMEQLIKFGKVKRGLLGVLVQNLTPNLAEALGMPGTTGAIVGQVSSGSPAAAAGLKSKDIIELINGIKVKNSSQLRSVVGQLPVGTRLTLKVKRDNKTLNLHATIRSLKKDENNKNNPVQAFLAGVRIRDFNQFDTVFGHIRGVQVIGVDQSSDAWISGLRPGDVILSANNHKVTKIDQLVKDVSMEKDHLLLAVQRQAGVIYMVIN